MKKLLLNFKMEIFFHLVPIDITLYKIRCVFFKDRKNNEFYFILNLINILDKQIPSWGWGLGIGDWGLGIGPNPQSPFYY